jgi:hypothetical protein
VRLRACREGRRPFTLKTWDEAGGSPYVGSASVLRCSRFARRPLFQRRTRRTTPQVESRRGELQYNIGVTADRLQREEEALEAFRHYLEETTEPTREEEVRERIAALERSIAERKATELALEEANVRYQSTGEAAADDARLPRSTVIGASALAGLGVAGVAAMGVGLAKDGVCTREIAGNCVVQDSATSWTYVYGALGAAALVGSATWFAISARRSRKERETSLSLTPAGVWVSGKF